MDEIELFQCEKCKRIFTRTQYGYCEKCHGAMRLIVRFEAKRP
jgi:rRNA maturation endonuclease Nob1